MKSHNQFIHLIVLNTILLFQYKSKTFFIIPTERQFMQNYVFICYREYHHPRVNKAVSQTEFQRFAAHTRSCLRQRGYEHSTALQFRGDVYRQHLASRGTQHSSRYRSYQHADLQPLISQGLLPANFDSRYKDTGEGLAVDYSLLLSWSVIDQNKGMLGEDLKPLPSVYTEQLRIKCGSRAVMK